MANDVSYFTVPGDSNTYQFNDPDAESALAALQTTVAEQAADIQANTTSINANASAIAANAEGIETNAAAIQTNAAGIGANTAAIGTLSSLTTTEKGSLVAAINEVDANTDTNTAATSTINNLFKQTRTQPSIYSSRATNLQGGYIQVGNLVFVSLFFTAAYPLTSGYATFLTGFPTPGPARVALAIHGIGDNAPHNQASIESDGSLRLYGVVGNNESIAVSGVYYTAS